MSDFFDDDNYEDGFTEDSFEEGVDLGLWRQLMAYTLHYPVEVTILAVCDMYSNCRGCISTDHPCCD